MPPLILHNVPDEELYVGEDGVQRPYAMVFPGSDGNPAVSRVRRAVAETGSFGKSTRRSRSRTGTPAAKREDPTLAAADAIFSQFLAEKSAENQSSKSPQRKPSLSTSITQPNISSSGALTQIDGNSVPSSRTPKKEAHKEPTEVILLGFKSTQQYAAIREYERIGGRICEDYPRDAPIEQRRYKADLRDPTSMRQKPLTPEEKAKAFRFAGGEHWIKVTFESAEAAEIAIESSPQTILGHKVYAEPYRGLPPTVDQPFPATGGASTPRGNMFNTQSLGFASGLDTQRGRRPTSTLPRSHTTPSMREINRGGFDSLSSPDSFTSSQTLDTATIASTSETITSGTVTGFPPSQRSSQSGQQLMCSRIPTAKRAKLLPAEDALLPQQSFSKRVMSKIPIIGWLSSDIIGSSVPRTELGEFDWTKASLYWKLVWWVDSMTGWFDVCGSDKED